MQTGDIHLIKDINDRLVLNLIREHEIISGADLAQITGMRPSTISNILKGLKAKDLIINRGKGESTDKGGKRPFLWSLNKEATYVIGIDVEIGEITAVVLNLSGEYVARHIYHVERVSDTDEVVGQIRDAVDDILIKAGLERTRILGMGIAVAGVVDSDTGVLIMSDISQKMNVPLRRFLEREFQFPIVIENNANSSAIGAKWVGSAIGAKDFMTILVEMNRDIGGLGIGLVLNNQLYHGARFCSGELNVQLPTLASTLGTLRNRLNEGKLISKYADNIKDLDIYTMIDMAKNGDTVAQLCFKILGHTIGKKIATSIALINPEKVILAGDISELDDLIVEPVRREIEMHLLNISNACLSVVTSRHGHYSVAAGAASLILEAFFQVPLVKKNSLMSL